MSPLNLLRDLHVGCRVVELMMVCVCMYVCMCVCVCVCVTNVCLCVQMYRASGWPKQSGPWIPFVLSFEGFEFKALFKVLAQEVSSNHPASVRDVWP